VTPDLNLLPSLWFSWHHYTTACCMHGKFQLEHKVHQHGHLNSTNVLLELKYWRKSINQADFSDTCCGNGAMLIGSFGILEQDSTCLEYLYIQAFNLSRSIGLPCKQDFGGIDFSKLGGAGMGGDNEEADEEDESDDDEMPALEGEDEEEEDTATPAAGKPKIEEVN
jgi:hypothetical protein